VNDVSKLWRHITPYLRSSLAQLYLRMASRYIHLVISFFKLFVANTALTIYYEQFFPQTAFLKSPCTLYKHVKMGCFVGTKLYSQILCQIFIKSAITNMAVVQNLRVYVQRLEYESTRWSLAHEIFLCTCNMDFYCQSIWLLLPVSDG
jgi:hypothetical protein